MAASGRNCFARARVLAALLAWGAYAQSARADALLELRLASAPHAPDDAPDVIVHVPTRIEPEKPLHVLVFLHGFSSCARALVASEPVPCLAGGAPSTRAYQLAKIHEEAKANSILLVPQLAFLARDANAPRFAANGGFDAFLNDVRIQLAGRLDAQAPLASVTLIAHSAGYRAAATILSDPLRKTPIASVVLFDALYAQWDVFASFVLAAPAHRLISLYTHDRSTTRGNKNLAELVRKAKKNDPQQGAYGQLEQERIDTPHGLIPTRHLAEVLEALF
jgi:hypothetical protein